MIRINLLKSELGQPGGGPPAASKWISRREAWAGVILLAVGAGLLYYLTSRAGAPARQGAVGATGGERARQETERAPEPVQKPESPPAVSAPGPPAQQPRSGSALARQPRRATAIFVRQEAQALIVAIQLGPGPIEHRAMKMENPNRVVVDIPDCQLLVPPEDYSRPVDHPEVKRVRASQFQDDPPVCRIVLDLAAFPSYEIKAGPNGLEIRVTGGKP